MYLLKLKHFYFIHDVFVNVNNGDDEGGDGGDDIYHFKNLLKNWKTYKKYMFIHQHWV